MKTTRPSRHPRIQFAVVLLTWLLSILACNLPQGASPDGISSTSLRQTLDAQYLAATQGIQITAGSPPQLPDMSVFLGLQTATPGSAAQGPPLPSADLTPQPFTIYPAQAGDTLNALAARFAVRSNQIVSPQPLPTQGLIPAGQLLEIPNVLTKTASPSALLPDSEVINAPSAADFDLSGYIQQAGGYLSTYDERVDSQVLTGTEIVQRVSSQASINPRLLLALLEHASGWVSGQPKDQDAINYPLGMHVSGRRGLYQELAIAATQLNQGYYGWRQGSMTDLKHTSGSIRRISPGLNAGSVALQHLYALLYAPEIWQQELYGENSLLATHARMFGDPWQRAAQYEPLYTHDLAQPELELPFISGERWSLTGGPHFSWSTNTPRGALDFAPVTFEPACSISRVWVTAPAAGVVVRSAYNVLALDLDGDGHEQTGWVLIFLHLADQERLPEGSSVEKDAPLGHPSCEGGRTTGTHVHMARKYNGEWLHADAPVAFVLGGWQAVAGARNYEGQLVKGDQIVSANPGGSRTSIIIR